MKNTKRLTDAYRFPGFKPQQMVLGIFGDQKARIIRLKRLEKKRDVPIAAEKFMVSMIAKFAVSEIFPVETCGSFSKWRSVALNARVAKK
jgi:hypothetical protein